MIQRVWLLAGAAVFFLLSGFSALLYQVSWQRILGVFSGMHIYSITIIVTAFMAGLGFGSLLGGRWADRWTARRAVLAFAGCEALIGAFALVSPWLYYDVAYLGLGFLVRYKAALPTVHLALLFVPTFLMGASLPLLARGLVTSAAVAARTIGLLYGVNTLGAALGALTGTWLLVGAFGFVGTVRIGAVLNFVAAAGAVALAARLGREADLPHREHPPIPPESSEPLGADARPFRLGTWVSIYALSGFVALSLEILWFRVLDVTIKSSPYVFGHLLGTFLIFLAAGSLVGAWIVRRGRRADRIFFWGQWSITVSAGIALLLLALYPTTWWPMAELFRFWNSDAGIVLADLSAAWADRGAPAQAELVRLAGTIWLVLPLALIAVPTFLMGLTFAYLQRAVQTDVDDVGWRVGLIQTANIGGSILGSFLTGTLFLSWFGTAHTFRILFLLGAVFGVLAALRYPVEQRLTRGAAAVVVSALLAAAVPAPREFWARFHGSYPQNAIVAEDASSIVVLQRLAENRAVIRVNGTGHSMMPFGGAHTILGCVPVLLHGDARDVLVIGLGSGNTAWAAASSPALERLDLYEIAEPQHAVLSEFRDVWFDFPPVGQLLDDPRVRLRFSDGRLALRLEPHRYDVIEADALEPYMAYSGNLYSLEFFELARDRLKDGGIFVSYTPTERTRRTMVAAFPHVLHVHAPGYLSFMIGSRDPIDYDREEILRRLESPAYQSYFGRADLAQAVTTDLRQFLGRVQVDAIRGAAREAYLEGDRNTDLFPRDEFDKSVPAG